MSRGRCLVCGSSPSLDIAPGILLDLRRLLGPKKRATINGYSEPLCWQCQCWAARLVGILL